MDSLVIEPRYDFSKIRPVKLESTCKIALRFLICLDFDDFSKVGGGPLTVGRGCVGMHRSRFGRWKSFTHP